MSFNTLFQPKKQNYKTHLNIYKDKHFMLTNANLFRIIKNIFQLTYFMLFRKISL